MSAPLETRHYIGLYGDSGRMHVAMGPGEPSSFKLAPHAPLPMDDGTFMYPVSAEIAAAWELDDEDELPENLHGDPTVSSDAARWAPTVDHDDHDIHGPVLQVMPDRSVTVDEDCDCLPGCEQCEEEGIGR